MRKFILPVAMLGFLAFAISARAASSTPEFVKMASMSDMFEIETSKLALNKATSGDIKSFAQHMVDDHTKASAEMKMAIQEAGVTAMPATVLDERHMGMLEALQAASGPEFDRLYLEAQQDAHDEAVRLYEDYAENGDNGALRQYAIRTLPTLRDHREHVDRLY